MSTHDCMQGWYLRESEDGERAWPCPICKPNWVHPESRKPERTPEEECKDQARAVKADVQRWWE